MRKLKWFTLCVFILALLICGRYPFYYEIKPVSGRLIDAGSGKIISGAGVKVVWGLVESTYHSNNSDAGWLGSQYARTDEKGYFSVPGWRRWWLEWFSTRRISSSSPTIRILKSGYVPKIVVVPALLGEENPIFQDKKNTDITFLGKQIVAGLRGDEILLEKLPYDPIMRYEIFHKTFVLPISDLSCKDPELIRSGFLTAIYQEQKNALLEGLDLGLSKEEEARIMNFKTPSASTCLQMANYLLRQGI